MRRFPKHSRCANMPSMENLGFNWADIRRIGVLGGTFDPIHYGHIVAAEAVSTRFDLERILFIPARRPPHKTKVRISDGHHRFVMCLIATANRADWSVSRLELAREGSSYTIQTLNHLRGLLGPECEIFFITGADMALDLPNWYRPDEMLAASRFVAVGRPGYQLCRLDDVLGPERAARIELVEASTPDVSGTEIRRRVATGESLSGLVPPPVSAYINAAGLYRAAEHAG